MACKISAKSNFSPANSLPFALQFITFYRSKSNELNSRSLLFGTIIARNLKIMPIFAKNWATYEVFSLYNWTFAAEGKAWIEIIFWLWIPGTWYRMWKASVTTTWFSGMMKIAMGSIWTPLPKCWISFSVHHLPSPAFGLRKLSPIFETSKFK